MGKSQTFRVVNGRAHFKCHACKAKRMVTIPPQVRTRSLRCHKCGELTRANFNRRIIPREQQRGKVLMELRDNISLEVDLYDISLYGVGFDVPMREVRKLSVGQEVQFRCSWNPRLFSQGRYIIRSIKGSRVGAQISHR